MPDLALQHRPSYAIHDAFAASPGARAVRALTRLSGSLSVSQWERRGGGYLVYPDAAHHLLSVYLAGGEGVAPRRVDGRALSGHGRPGAICVIPAGEQTAWDNAGYVSVLHLYFQQADLEALFERRMQAPRPRVFAEDAATAGIAQALVAGLDWTDGGDRLAVEHAALAMLARVSSLAPAPVSTFATGRAHARGVECVPGVPIASASRRATGRAHARDIARVAEYIEAHLDAPLRLADLAAQAHLGVRQFTRVFEAATGTTVHAHVMARRIERAAALIDAGVSLAEVAARTGFSSQSHLTRRFARARGCTPGAWRLRR